jgi:preprotein translocase subunit SecG
MYTILIVMHLIVCIGLIAVVLVQSGKGGGLAGGAFGGSAQTVFGGRGATDFVTRATMVLGALFFTTSLVLALMSSGLGRSSRSLIQEEARRAGAAQPQAPGARPTGVPTGGVPLGGTRPAPTTPAPATAPAPAPPRTAPPGGK